MAKPLKLYRSKRNFKQSPEPSGDKTIRKAAYPRFVIQKHDATRLHCDLRLEIGGVFKSWAVTRGPSLDPAEKRLAVEVEDPPSTTATSKARSPRGNMGAAASWCGDRGFW